ncbi:hypothetical protein B0H11DRAFT_2010868 [Mycena galericulata]|nr:hypothetical protein B0H11DRAFT_2010868 [Mycena galericulata]
MSSAPVSPAPASASTPIVASKTKTPSPAKATKKVSKPKATKAAAPKATKPKVTKKTAAPAHPPWKELIKECIATSDAPARQGVSRSAIKKYAEDQYKLTGAANVSQLNRAIVSGVEAGIFVQPKGPSGCVKLAPKVRSEASKENSKPVSKSASKPAAAKPKASTSKTTAGKKSTTIQAQDLPPHPRRPVVGKKPATTKKPVAKKVAAKKVLRLFPFPFLV